MKTNAQYIIDEKGRKKAVVLDIKEYNKILHALEELEQANVQKGRFINDIDNQEFRKVAVLGKSVVEKLFKDADPIGEYIKINNAMFRVVGTYTDKNDRVGVVL